MNNPRAGFARAVKTFGVQAELLAHQRLEELEQARAELANLMSKKRRSAT